jgi:hypothetical protein
LVASDFGKSGSGDLFKKKRLDLLQRDSATYMEDVADADAYEEWLAEFKSAWKGDLEETAHLEGSESLQAKHAELGPSACAPLPLSRPCLLVVILSRMRAAPPNPSPNPTPNRNRT